MADYVESKVFGIGSESFVVCSQEFYMGYAAAHQMMLTLDLGHFHPTENVADKISAILLFIPEIMFHLSRGVRWDSDHVEEGNYFARLALNERFKTLPFGNVWDRYCEKAGVPLDSGIIDCVMGASTCQNNGQNSRH